MPLFSEELLNESKKLYIEYLRSFNDTKSSKAVINSIEDLLRYKADPETLMKGMVDSKFKYNDDTIKILYPDQSLSKNKGNCFDICLILRKFLSAIEYPNTLGLVNYASYNKDDRNYPGHAFPIFMNPYTKTYHIFNYLQNEKSIYGIINGPFENIKELFEIAQEAFSMLLSGSHHIGYNYSRLVTKEAMTGIVLNDKSLDLLDKMIDTHDNKLTQPEFNFSVPQIAKYFRERNKKFNSLLENNKRPKALLNIKSLTNSSFEDHLLQLPQSIATIIPSEEGIDKMRKVFQKYKKE